MYRIDLHPSTGGDNYVDVPSCPFEIPLGALLPQERSNILPAGKNIGTTHITNGRCRLHPVEWNIGEVASSLAAHCLNAGTGPHDVRSDDTSLKDFQNLLHRQGGRDPLAGCARLLNRHIQPVHFKGGTQKQR